MTWPALGVPLNGSEDHTPGLMLSGKASDDGARRMPWPVLV
jgi:hypothetical protein